MREVRVSGADYLLAHEGIALGWSRRTVLFLKFWIRYLIGR